MTVSIRVTARIVLLLAFALVAGGPWAVPAASAAPEDHLSRIAQPATEIFNFLQINLADSGGAAVSFPAGQQICLAVTISPPLTPGGTPWITHCYGELPGQTLHANAPGTPFLRSSSYSIAVASNTTGCTVTTPAMTPADYGAGSGWYAIFNVTADCPDVPVPPTMTPVPTLAPGPTSTAIPTATAVPTSTAVPTATAVPTSTTIPTATTVPADTYDLLGLWFNPVGSTPAVLPGEVCVRIVADPPFTGTSLYDFCTTSSSTNTGFGTDPGESFPTSSTYTALIVSNASGCLVTSGPLREATGDSGFLGIIDVMIDCDSTPDSTATATVASTATMPATATATATVPATATLVSSSTATGVPSITPTSESTPPSTESVTTPEATTPASTDAAPTATAKSTNVSVVTTLPTTGAGPMSTMSEVLFLLTGGLLLVVASASMYRSQSNR